MSLQNKVMKILNAFLSINETCVDWKLELVEYTLSLNLVKSIKGELYKFLLAQQQAFQEEFQNNTVVIRNQN